ncbi:MAG: alanine racemase [Verrucomicrobia bacterium]|nr:alanine racemase [Verrucomicrobiota bacterium]
MPDNAQHRCWVEIHLDAFERNLKRIQASLPHGVRYISVVKADAYGHGMPQVVRRLMQCGVDYFAVANTREAALIREMGAGWPILILSPVLPEEAPDLIRDDLTATISDFTEAQRLNTLAHSKNTTLKVHLKIDTGMGRLGVWHEQALKLYEAIKAMPSLRLEGIYTHFSSADSDPEFTETQRQRFLGLLEIINPPEDCIIHADNSAGLDSFTADRRFNAVRVGLLQFGIPPYPDSVLAGVRVEPVLHFNARIGLIKKLPTGTGISYGHTHHLPKETTIAVLTAGYGDGVPYALGNRGKVLVHGHPCAVLGRVTMDQTIVDVSGIPDLQVGDVAVFIGKSAPRQITANAFSDDAQTIPWDALCSISKRVTRVYFTPREL